MAIACLAAEAEHAGAKLARRGYALVDGSAADLAAAVTAFDALRGNADESQRIAPGHPLVATLLAQPVVRDLVDEAVGPGAKTVRAIVSDEMAKVASFQPWHQALRATPENELSGRLILRWHLDLIGPADGGLRVLPGSHTKGRLTPADVDRLAAETPAVELAVSAGTVLAMRPLLVLGARRRTTRGHRRILQVELAAQP